MKKILITGITGFVGSHLADFILEKKKKLSSSWYKKMALVKFEKY
tara:strand:+ start:328 stop:462 length:135 start_codon:yes stop_codon:yes gene_type:complete